MRRRSIGTAARIEGGAALGGAAAGDDAGREVIAQSEAFRATLALAHRAARGRAPICLRGETGSGKEVVARQVHAHGRRAGGPFVAVNCGALPDALIESTLFGHTRGAFTGASDARPGVFEAADGGTLFLDEVGELPPRAQSALLRVLETGRVTRLGSVEEIEVDVRVVTATHRDLSAMRREGTFREDLYHRIAALEIEVPPLRERREDIGALANAFLADAIASTDTAVRGIDLEARRALLHHTWPGNARELRNAIERAVLLADGERIGLADLPPHVVGDGPVARTAAPARRLLGEDESLRECIERLTAEVLLEALEETRGNQTQAARRLAMPRRTLVHKLRALGVRWRRPA